MPYKTQITRTETITVKSTNKDQYNTLHVVDTAGREHKISEKRAVLHPVFQAGNSVKLEYAVYQDKEYIANATLVSGAVAPPPPGIIPPTISQEAARTLMPPTQTTTQGNRDGAIDTAVAIKAAVELICAGKVAVDNTLAFKVFKWLNAKIPD